MLEKDFMHLSSKFRKRKEGILREDGQFLHVILRLALKKRRESYQTDLHLEKLTKPTHLFEMIFEMSMLDVGWQ